MALKLLPGKESTTFPSPPALHPATSRRYGQLSIMKTCISLGEGELVLQGFKYSQAFVHPLIPAEKGKRKKKRNTKAPPPARKAEDAPGSPASPRRCICCFRPRPGPATHGRFPCRCSDASETENQGKQSSLSSQSDSGTRHLSPPAAP